MNKIHTTHAPQTAFSLVELSIVLVILGLLTGGILAGQSLIRAAELRSVTTDYQKYQAAMLTFRDKYMAIPGDMANATRFWGDNTSACADGAIANGTPGTCNGNGDGLITWPGNPVASTTYEWTQAWNQLALAGLVEGSYTGITTAATPFVAGGTTFPRGKISNTNFHAIGRPNYVGDGNYFAIDYGNSIELTQWGSGSSPIFRPEEAWNIDTKIDDGKPAYGKIVAIYWAAAQNCLIADDGTPANNDFNTQYKLTETSTTCNISLRNIF